MEGKTFIYFIGTAGSGKSTLTKNFNRWTELKDIDAIKVNLDPGAENLPYDPDVDVRDWISLEEVMDSYELGPNGAQIACADMLALNTEDIKNSIDQFKADYVLVDTPGQLELFVFREAGKHLIQTLNPQRSMIAYLMDYALAKKPSSFVSQLLLSISTNFRLQKSQVNLLTKADMLPEEEIKKVKNWSRDTYELENALYEEEASMYREMNQEILKMIKDVGEQIRLHVVGEGDLYEIEDFYTTIQMQFAGGEDLTD
ncbi:MAG: ATP/GTP-binding protein [Candidatus Thermoplasmatota archaeon]